MARQDDTGKSSRAGSAPFRNRRFTTFVVCLLISGLFWLLHALSKEYRLVIRVPVIYSHLPERGLVAVDMPDSIDAEVSGSGFTILAYQWTNLAGSLELDARQAHGLGNGEYALSTYAHPERLEGPINGLHVLRVMPDTLVLSFAGRVEKKVPVRPRVSVSCAPSYRPGDSIRTVPAYVTVSGAEALLRQINWVETEQKTFSNLDKSVNTPIRLVLPPKLGQVEVKPAEVTLVLPVGKYTEKRVTVPVEPVNVPPNAVLKTIPDKVEVVFQVSVENYNAISAEMFRVVADYQRADAKTGEIPLQIVRQPINILSLHAEPQRVEYIIRK